jgi:hypothetical protein
MVDWFMLGGGCGNGESGEYGGIERESGEREARDLFLR